MYEPIYSPSFAFIVLSVLACAACALDAFSNLPATLLILICAPVLAGLGPLKSFFSFHQDL